MRYDPPPNWPQPPAGWSPPPGWAPDPAWGPPPPGWALWVPDAPSGSGRSTGAVWAAVGVVVLLLLGAGVVGAVLLTRGSDATTTVAAPTSGAPATDAPVTGSVSTAPATSSTPATASAPAPTGCADAPGTSSAPAPLGQGAVVGSFCVAITRVVQDATAAVLAESSLNPPPTNGRYLLLDLDALNQSGSSEDPYFALYVSLRTADGTEYEDTGCTAVLPDDLVAAGDAAPGATVTGSVCLDLPAGDLPGAELTIAGAGGTDTRVFATS